MAQLKLARRATKERRSLSAWFAMQHVRATMSNPDIPYISFTQTHTVAYSLMGSCQQQTVVVIRGHDPRLLAATVSASLRAGRVVSSKVLHVHG